MTRRIIQGAVIGAAVAVVGLVIWLVLPDSAVDRDARDEQRSLRTRRISEQERKERLQRRRLAIRQRMEGRRDGLAIGTNTVPTQAILDEIERKSEDELNEFQRKILKELDLALLHDDKPTALARIRQLLRSLESAKGLSSATHAMLRRHVVNSLGWLGGDGAPELISFLADDDPAVRESAMNQFEQALWDFTLGDREASQIVIAASQVLTDGEILDSILFTVDFKMRRSVGVETLLEISRSGTAEAKEMLPDKVYSFTGDDTIQTEEDLLRWAEEHPDDIDDEQFYGPQRGF